MTALELTTVAVEQPETCVVALEIEIAAATVRERVRSVFRALAREAAIPGFRKGKAPKELLRRVIGPDKIRREVTDKLVPAAYEQALKERGLEPMERASVDVVEFAEDAPLKFKARVTVKPEIALGEYTGLALLQPREIVSDAAIQQQLESLRAAHAIVQEVEREAQNGDVVTADLEVKIEDESEPRKRELGPVALGAGQLNPPIDEHVLGARVGDERAFSLTYGDDYDDASLRGKRADFRLKLSSVKEKILPDLDDDLAREVDAECADLAALKQRIRERLQEGKDEEARIAARRRLVETVVARAQLEVSSSYLERRAHQRMQQLIEELTQRSLTLDEWLEAQKTTAEELKQKFGAEATTETRRNLVLEAIAKKEAITLAADDINAELLNLARTLGKDPRELAERMVRNGTLRALERAVFERKVALWLLERANVTYITESEQ